MENLVKAYKWNRPISDNSLSYILFEIKSSPS